MNPAHLHLLVNHIAPLATAFSVVVLLLALVQRSSAHTLRTAVCLMLIGSAGAIIADETGDDAEDYVEAFPGVGHEPIHEHKRTAEPAIVMSVIAGLIGLLGAVIDAVSGGRRRVLVTTVLLVASGAATAALLNAAYTGGQIRHPEAVPGFDVKQLAEPADLEKAAL